MVVGGAAPVTVDGSFEDVRDGIFRIDDFSSGANEGIAFACSVADCG